MTTGPWKQKFDMRVRRLLGVTDDDKTVEIDTNIGDQGGCDTCGYGADSPIELRCAGKYKAYTDLADLINDLDKVVLS